MAEFDFWVAVGIKAAQNTLRQSRDAEAVSAFIEANNKRFEDAGIDRDIEYSIPSNTEPEVKLLWDRIEQFMRDNPHIVAADESQLWRDVESDRKWSYRSNPYPTKRTIERVAEAFEHMRGCLMTTYGRRTNLSFNRDNFVSWTPDQIYHSADEVELNDIPKLKDASRVPRRNYRKFD